MGRPSVAVAYSGGRDSTALLHATLAAAEPLGIEVLALHVHHGLNARADAWQLACEAQCKRWARGRALRFFAERITTAPPHGASVEAWARRERYAALRRMALAHGADLLLLAQHRRDQAETFLLQALRGAGPAGLAAMPASAERDGIVWARPWLAWPREAIEAYARRHRLRWIDDDSNDHPRFARNRLRLQLWPQLTAAFADAEPALADCAARAHEAAAALAELAALDLGAVANRDGLDVGAWSALSPARRSNALRAWLAQQTGHAAAASLVARLMAELTALRPARWPLADGELRLYRGLLHHVASPTAPTAPPAPTAAPDAAVDVAAPAPPPETTLAIRQPGRYALPGWGGSLQIDRVDSGGVALARLAHLELRPRCGGERFKAGALRPARMLKKQYQAAGLASWQRIGPLVYAEGRLIFVPGLGLDADAVSDTALAQPQVSLAWLPNRPATAG